MRKIAIVCLVVMSACTHLYYYEVRTPGGAVGYAVQCDKYVTRCYQAASEACPGGYKIIDQNGSQDSQGGAVVMGNKGVASSLSRAAYSWLIECTGAAVAH